MKSLLQSKFNSDIPVRTALIYIAVGGFWILFSDLLLKHLVSDPETMTRIELYKGWFFIAATGVLFYFLLHKFTSRISKSEKEMKETNEILKALVTSSPLAFFALDPEGKIRIWNPAAERMFGWKEEEVIGRPNPIVAEDDQDAFRDLRERVLKGEVFTGLELKRVKRKGESIDVSVSTAPISDTHGSINGTMVLLSDISQRKRAEEALRESEERYRIVAETALDAIITIDEDSRILFINQAGEKIFGYSRAEMTGKPLTMLMPQRMRQPHLDAMDKYLATGVRTLPWERVEIPGLHKNGREILLEISYGEFMKNDRHFFTGFIRDITERKKTEEDLRDSEKKYRSLFEESRDVVYISTPEGRFLDINPAGVELFGFSSKDEMLNIDLERDLYANPGDRKQFMDLIAKNNFVKDYEITMKRRNGERLTIQLTGTAVRNDRGEIVAYRGLMRDVTERKRLEQQLIQSQKMEATGQLAGGMAHDFNNILTAIISYASLLQMSIGPNEPAGNYIDQILTLSNRAASLIQNLLAFSRKQMINPKPVDLNEIILRVEKLISRIIGADVSLRVLLSDRALTIMADSGLMEQVLVNLITNARDAMPRGGSLTIATHEKEMDDFFVNSHGFGRPGRYALLTVTDTGTGMDEETRRKIFEPFFTTKEVGKGTGLGMSMVYGIIKQHDGFITVYSEPGKGTTIRIYLPLIRLAVQGQSPETGTVPAGGKEAILIAEDEADVRIILRTLLRKFGYEVIEAVDGRDALEKFKKYSDKIQLLILDLILPKMNGRDTFEEIRKLKPGIRAIFMSGYTEEMMTQKGLLEEGVKFISKPFSPNELLKSVREVIEK